MFKKGEEMSNFVEFEVGQIEYNGKPHILMASICLSDKNYTFRAALKMSITIYTMQGDRVAHLDTNIHVFGKDTYDVGLDFLKSRYSNSNNKDMLNFIKWWELYSYDDGFWEGTRAQMQLIKNADRNEVDNLDKAVAYLKERGMYEVEHNGEKVRYREKWWYPKLPDSELQAIKEFIGRKKAERKETA